MSLLRKPGYAVPLIANLTGSIWFFLLVGKAGESFFSKLAFLLLHQLADRCCSGIESVLLHTYHSCVVLGELIEMFVILQNFH